MGVWCLFETDFPEFDHNFPRCGTVACEAGWIGLRSGVVVANGLAFIADRHVDWIDMADVIAGFSEIARVELYRSFIAGEHFLLEDGTREQAEATAKFLGVFKRKWRRELKARIILPGGVVQGERDGN